GLWAVGCGLWAVGCGLWTIGPQPDAEAFPKKQRLQNPIEFRTQPIRHTNEQKKTGRGISCSFE
ncbi:MAG: hypothetical protein EBU11_12625, partial [Gammaproteobacteria bacterium]|nr:hypothetical protein [Gammaproteobacteria bacterium]